MTRDQIIEAAMRLLGDLPIEEVTTRRLAGELGVSQPALFRHFASREALFLAVIARARSDHEGLALGLLHDGRGAIESLESLGMGLLARVERDPGLPRLIFSSAPGADPVRLAMRQLVSMQLAFAAELVRGGQRSGEVSADVSADAAASLFVAMVQGQVMQWEAAGRSGSLTARLTAPFALWRRAVAPEVGAAPQTASAPAPKPSGAPLRVLDVRPILAGGADPLGAVLGALEALPRGGALVVLAPFRPAPLMVVLARRGCVVSEENIGAGRHMVTAVVGGPAVVDLRDLEAPEPLERVLSAAESLGAGEVFLARVPRFPRMLVARLSERGRAHAVVALPDESALVRLGPA